MVNVYKLYMDKYGEVFKRDIHRLSLAFRASFILLFLIFFAMYQMKTAIYLVIFFTFFSLLFQLLFVKTGKTIFEICIYFVNYTFIAFFIYFIVGTTMHLELLMLSTNIAISVSTPLDSPMAKIGRKVFTFMVIAFVLSVVLTQPDFQLYDVRLIMGQGLLVLRAIIIALTLLYIMSLIRFFENQIHKTDNLLVRLMEKDILTDAFNRMSFFDFSERLLTAEKNADQTHGLLAMDIDNFKQVNTQYGHYGGDKVLISLVKTVNEHIRENDKIFRIGGEEFAVLLLDCHPQNLIQIAEKIRAAIEEMQVAHEGEKIKITVSIGACMIKEFDKSIYEYLKEADIALYQAKDNGKNRVVHAIE